MHAATIWQIALAADTTFSSPVADIFTAEDLVLITIDGLTPSTAYIARARYVDDSGTLSDWSESVSFTTLDENGTPEPGSFTATSQGCGGC